MRACPAHNYEAFLPLVASQSQVRSLAAQLLNKLISQNAREMAAKGQDGGGENTKRAQGARSTKLILLLLSFISFYA